MRREPAQEAMTVGEPWFYAIWTASAYLVGSISIGLVVARAKGVDIRSVGTGNPGSANVYREIGPAYGVAVFSLDFAKGAVTTLPLFLADAPTAVVAVAAGAVLAGHFFPPPWTSFGGTGMAVSMGTTAGLLPAGLVVAAIPSAICIRLSRSAGYTGALLFTTAIVSGWLVHRDEVAAIAVLLGAVAVRLKAMLQYRGQCRADARRSNDSV